MTYVGLIVGVTFVYACTSNITDRHNDLPCDTHYSSSRIKTTHVKRILFFDRCLKYKPIIRMVDDSDCDIVAVDVNWLLMRAILTAWVVLPLVMSRLSSRHKKFRRQNHNIFTMGT